MLLVTDQAATLFREILAREEITGEAIRLVARPTDDGSTHIVLTAIDGPTEADVPTQADGVDGLGRFTHRGAPPRRWRPRVRGSRDPKRVRNAPRSGEGPQVPRGRPLGPSGRGPRAGA